MGLLQLLLVSKHPFLVGLGCLSSFLGRYTSVDFCQLDRYTTGSIRHLPLPLVLRLLHHRRVVNALSATCSHVQLGLVHGGNMLALGGLPGEAILLVEARSARERRHAGSMEGCEVWSR